jgi:predicted TIM-barrel enzyme
MGRLRPIPRPRIVVTETSSAKPTPRARRRSFRIVTGEAHDWEGVAADEVLLVCPWLGGLDPQTGLWLAALPIHDCNAFVDSAWRLSAPEALRERCHVGIFALDRLRSGKQIFGPLREKSVASLINLPSIGFFDGATAQTFGRLGFTLEKEIAFLARARSEGFGTALCARSDAVLEPERAAQFAFVLRHQGPDRPIFVETP